MKMIDDYLEIIKYTIDITESIEEAVNYINLNRYNLKEKDVVILLEDCINALDKINKSLRDINIYYKINDSAKYLKDLLNQILEYIILSENDNARNLINTRLIYEYNSWKNNIEKNLKKYTYS